MDNQPRRYRSHAPDLPEESYVGPNVFRDAEELIEEMGIRSVSDLGSVEGLFSELHSFPNLKKELSDYLKLRVIQNDISSKAISEARVKSDKGLPHDFELSLMFLLEEMNIASPVVAARDHVDRKWLDRGVSVVMMAALIAGAALIVSEEAQDNWRNVLNSFVLAIGAVAGSALYKAGKRRIKLFALEQADIVACYGVIKLTYSLFEAGRMMEAHCVPGSDEHKAALKLAAAATLLMDGFKEDLIIMDSDLAAKAYAKTRFIGLEGHGGPDGRFHLDANVLMHVRGDVNSVWKGLVVGEEEEAEEPGEVEED